MKWRKFLSWLKAHQIVAMYLGLFAVLLVMAVIFLLTAWLVSSQKPYTAYHLMVFGFYGALLSFPAIRLNYIFQQWLKKP